MGEGSFVWAGAIGLVAIAALLITIAWPVVSGWEDNWREYAHDTRFGGLCTSEEPPPECTTDPPLERWQLIPWLLTVGLSAALLALCLPYGRELRRRGGDRRYLKGTIDFLKSQK